LADLIQKLRMKTPNSLKTVSTGLAGAAALAASTEAYGAVVSATLPANFIPSSGVTSPANQTPWDVDGNGTVDFSLFFSQASTGGNFVSGIYGYGGVGTAAAVAYLGPYVAYVNRLVVGNTIGPASVFNQNTGYVAAFASRFNGTYYGQFVSPNTRGFIGFEFTNASGLHYGYLELMTSQFASAGSPGGQTFFQAFYETTPNTAITIVPEPRSLAALAFGAAILGGVALNRRKGAAKA
jgi:hypothetical protein